MIGEPVLTLYLDDSLESRRLKAFTAAKKIETKIVNVPAGSAEYDDINPEHIYPFLSDRDLLLYGAPIDEYLHERFPVPMLLPHEPRDRALTRFLSDEVRSWYPLIKESKHIGPAKAQHLAEVEQLYEPAKFWMVCEQETIVDVSLIVFLHELQTRGFWNPAGTRLRMYYEALTGRYGLVKNGKDVHPAFTELEEQGLDDVGEL